MVRTVAIASLVGAFALAAPGLALAGGGNSSAGSGKSTSSIALASPETGSIVASDTSWPRYGDLVTFDISTSEPAPYVNLKCYQSGQLVAEGWEGFFDGAWGDRLFGLWSSTWTGGAADCSAYLDKHVNGRWRVLASTSFHVSE